MEFNIQLVITAALSLAVLGFLFALILAIASKKLAVKKDPRVEKINDILPQANCGACGYIGCADYAKAIIEGKAEISECPVGGQETADEIADILGVESGETVKNIAMIKCSLAGTSSEKFEYKGIETCAASKIISGGIKECSYACIGLGDCIKVCPVDAISKNDEGRIIIDDEKCIGCSKCVKECPNDIIEMVPHSKTVHVLCRNHDLGKAVNQVCKVGCIACRICQKKCPHDAIHVVDNLAVIDYEKCTECGICVEACPKKCIFFVNGKPVVEKSAEEKAEA